MKAKISEIGELGVFMPYPAEQRLKQGFPSLAGQRTVRKTDRHRSGQVV